MNSSPIIRVNNLTVMYQDLLVLDGISFNVHTGEVFVILGGSGCGKTTLLNHMIGLKRPASGNIWLFDKNLVELPPPDTLSILKKIGVTYQTGALFGSMNLLENVRFPLEELTDLPLDAATHIAHNKLRTVGLGNFAYYMPAQISGGMQKRAAIARAMALDPDILFLDEPSAGLDPVTSAQLDQLILDLSDMLGVTFVIVSHELPSIYNIAQRVIMLHEHKIIATGNPSDLREHSDNPFVKQFFNRKAETSHG